jgi:RNA polymerase sigma factor (sigma-70 family)
MMAEDFPSELSSLLGATDAAARETAWAAFLSAYSRLLLHVARQVGRDYDTAMDAYAHILEQLRADDCHRLRAYAPDGRTKFTTWLVVVARRLCLDHHRHHYGRLRGNNPEAVDARAVRRRLQDLIAADLDVSPEPAPDLDQSLEARERNTTLGAILDALPPRDRLLLKLRYEDDLSAREIAGILGFPTPFHVYRRLNALLAELRRMLRARGLDGTSA